MTWTSFHHRGETLRAVIATADERRDGRLPMDVDGVAETFEDELSLLAALQLKWHTRLAGRIERELTSQPLDLSGAVAVAWGHTYDELPGVRLVLDHHRSHPLDEAMSTAMTKAAAKEHALLAAMAGLAGVHDVGAAGVGSRIEQQARADHRGLPALPVRPAAEARPSLLERLRSVLAA